MLEIPDAAADPRFARNADRSTGRDELRPLLVRAFAARTATDWEPLLTAAGVPCASVLAMDAAFERARVLGLDPIAHAGPERTPGVRHPISFSATPPAYPLGPPAPDADREWVRSLLR